jgi:hypothetical protein
MKRAICEIRGCGDVAVWRCRLLLPTRSPEIRVLCHGCVGQVQQLAAEAGGSAKTGSLSTRRGAAERRAA